MKKTIILILVLVIVVFGLYFLLKNVNTKMPPSTPVTDNTTPAVTNPEPQPPVNKDQAVIGTSVEGRPIMAYHFGIGTSTEILFVGGIHGGYEWNTALMAYQLMDYLKQNPGAVPANEKVTVIPVLNPDGLNKVVGTTTGNFTATDVPTSQDAVIAGRFNGNTVDLNRNFDCDWQANGTWQSKTVSGGTGAFSEPESQAIKTYIETNKPAAVVVWYSSAGGVYASSCHNGVSSQTNTLTSTFAKASGYPAYQSFDFYATTGDMVNWLAKNNIPAISVLLTNHTSTEWSKNQAGVAAVLKYYSK